MEMGKVLTRKYALDSRALKAGWWWTSLCPGHLAQGSTKRTAGSSDARMTLRQNKGKQWHCWF